MIVFGYIVAAFWQNKRIDDLKTWLESEFKHIDGRFGIINEKLDKLDGRVKVLEDARSSGVVGSLR